ncbi:MAG: tetratricopeptide repeat protein [Lachnospiraceae bacterium]|nr:tetratricopeptide repeat protein [Lachnospiraceae bacterium]
MNMDLKENGMQKRTRMFFNHKILVLFLVLSTMLLTACKEKEDLKETYRREGIQALEEENYDLAIEKFETALTQTHGIIKKTDYDINYYLGYTLYLNGQYDESKAVFDAMLDIREKETDAYYYRALSKLKLGDRAGAREDYDKVTSADPENYDTYIDIYFCMCDAGYGQDGQNYLKETLENAKKMSDYDKGRICYFLGDYSNARVYLEKAKDMKDPETILILGKTYEAIDDNSYAASLYNSYLVEKGNNASVYNQLGVCRLRLEDYDAALAAFTSGLSLEDPEWEQELLYNEAIAYEYKLDFDTAKKKLEAYVEKYPKDEAAKRELLFLSTR